MGVHGSSHRQAEGTTYNASDIRAESLFRRSNWFAFVPSAYKVFAWITEIAERIPSDMLPLGALWVESASRKPKKVCELPTANRCCKFLA